MVSCSDSHRLGGEIAWGIVATGISSGASQFALAGSMRDRRLIGRRYKDCQYPVILLLLIRLCRVASADPTREVVLKCTQTWFSWSFAAHSEPGQLILQLARDADDWGPVCARTVEIIETARDSNRKIID